MNIPTATRQPIWEYRAQEKAFNFNETQANYRNMMAKRQEDRAKKTQDIQDKFRTEINPLLVAQQQKINTMKDLENTRFGEVTPHVLKKWKDEGIIRDDQIEVLLGTQDARKQIINEAGAQALIKTAMDNLNYDVRDLEKESQERTAELDKRFLTDWTKEGGFADRNEEISLRDYGDDEYYRALEKKKAATESESADIARQQALKYLNAPLFDPALMVK